MAASMMNKQLRVSIQVEDVEGNTLGAIQTAILIQDIDATLAASGYETSEHYDGFRGNGLLEVIQAVQDHQDMLKALANLSIPIVTYLVGKFSNKPQNSVITIITPKQQKSIPILKHLSEDELLQVLLDLDPEDSLAENDNIHVTVEIAVPTNTKA